MRRPATQWHSRPCASAGPRGLGVVRRKLRSWTTLNPIPPSCRPITLSSIGSPRSAQAPAGPPSRPVHTPVPRHDQTSERHQRHCSAKLTTVWSTPTSPGGARHRPSPATHMRSPQPRPHKLLRLPPRERGGSDVLDRLRYGSPGAAKPGPTHIRTHIRAPAGSTEIAILRAVLQGSACRGTLLRSASKRPIRPRSLHSRAFGVSRFPS